MNSSAEKPPAAPSVRAGCNRLSQRFETSPASALYPWCASRTQNDIIARFSASTKGAALS